MPPEITQQQPGSVHHYGWEELQHHPDVINAVALSYVRSFQESEWAEQHSTANVLARLKYDLAKPIPYNELLVMQRQDGTVIAAGWQGGGLATASELAAWLITSYEMTEERELPDREAVIASVVASLGEPNQPPVASIMNTVDFFVIPEERKGSTAPRLMSQIGKSSKAQGMTHYLGWTKHDSEMNGMMTGRGAIVAAKFFDMDREFHVLLGSIDGLVGRVRQRMDG